MIKRISFLIVFILYIFIQGSTFVIDPTENAVWHNEKGVQFLKDGYVTYAIDEFKLAIGLSPNSATTASFLNNLGIAYLKINKYDLALSCFQKAVNLNPYFLDYYKNLVKTYKLKNMLTNIAIKYVKLLKKNNSDSKSWLILGLVYEELGYKNYAKSSFEQFKKLEPESILVPGIDELIKNLI